MTTQMKEAHIMKKLMAILFAACLSGAVTMPVFAAGHQWNNTNTSQAQTKKKKKAPKKKKKGTPPPAALYR